MVLHFTWFFCFCIGKLPNGIPCWGVICAYTSTGALIREMHLIKSTFFNAGILRTVAKYALNSEYAHISDVHLISTVLCLDKLMHILHVFYYSGTEQVDAAVLRHPLTEDMEEKEVEEEVEKNLVQPADSIEHPLS